MKVFKLLILGAFVGATMARAVIVDFHGTGTYQAHNGMGWVYLPFSVGFSYDTAATPIDTFATQQLRPAISLSLTIEMVNGSTWTHTSNEVRVTMNNAVNGTWDGLTISTKWPMTEMVPAYVISGTPYPVVNYSFELTKYSGGVFADGDFSLPAAPTFIGDLAGWDIKHAKMYINNGSSDFAVFNHPLNTLGAPIPEPSTWAAILGASAMGVVVWQRRRKGGLGADSVRSWFYR